MTTPSAPVPSSSAPAHSRSMPALLAAATVVVVTVVLVLLFGLARPPELESLAESPEPGLPAVAWVEWDREPCLLVADADREVREVACGLQGEEVIGWEDDGIALVVWGPTEQLEVLDPETGGVVEVRALPGEAWREPRPLGDGGDTRSRDGILTARYNGTVVWEVDAPESYWLNPGSVSPDGRYVAAFDSADRLLLLDASGDRPPRVWLEDVESWQPPVWEGTPVPSMDD